MQDTTSVENSVTVEKLMRDFKVVVQDAEGLLKATAEDLGEKLSERARDARARLKTSVDAARTTVAAAEQKATDRVRQAGEAIREHPYQSLVIAFGVGLFLGLLTGRR